ncbi:MAG: 16S rRNA (guanine(966)-N(2))-methyltransferase RsmD [Clostridiales bacterium]|nr:16S rRNA (guanine(966)-N(2))-methyltransferase RsmD [Clostridiales bacterium]
MRVVAGKFKGMRLLEFKGEDIRPTSDYAKESLFNILKDKVIGATFLDLFAGTGNMGIEALSRGAEEVVFVDKSKKSIELIKKNLEKVKATAEVKNTDSLSYLSLTDKKFDIIFIDPPYKSNLGFLALDLIKEKDLLTEDGVAIFENEDKKEVEGLIKVDERKYGRAILTFFKKERV